MALYDREYIIKAIRGDYSYSPELRPTFVERVLSGLLGCTLGLSYFLVYIGSKLPILSSVIETTARVYSRNSIGFFLRGAYNKTKLKNMGKNVIIDTGAIIWNPEVIEIGDNTHIDTYSKIEGGAAYGGSVKVGKLCHIGHNTHLHGGGQLIIGDYVGIASDARVYSASNFYEDPKKSDRFVNMSVMAPPKEQYILKKPVIIEDHAFIGIGAIVLPGVKIGKGAIIGAGSIVNTDIPRFTIAIGSPARVVKKRVEKKNESSST